jgi:hypothetical protein
LGITLADVGHEADSSDGTDLLGKCGAIAERQGGQTGIASPGVLIVIDLSGAKVSLHDAFEFTRFSVLLAGDGDLAELLRQSGLGSLGADGEHVVVDPAALRALAGPAADDDWDEGFAGMCAYAAGKGWVEPDGGIIAHVSGAS